MYGYLRLEITVYHNPEYLLSGKKRNGGGGPPFKVRVGIRLMSPDVTTLKKHLVSRLNKLNSHKQ